MDSDEENGRKYQERVWMEYANKVARNWVRVDCEGTVFEGKCRKIREVAERYDQEHQKVEGYDYGM